MNSSANCKNCASPISGHYCSNCGQPAEVHVPSTRELVHEVLEGLTHSDSRLWRTLKALWFKPGKLTEEFVAGRRMAYLPPFRLYLIMSLIFFFVASFTHPHGKIVGINGVKLNEIKADSGQPMDKSQCMEMKDFAGHPSWKSRMQHACEATVSDHGEGLMHNAATTLPKAMFVFLPAVAALHMLLYWRPRYRYAEHLIFFLHQHAFFFTIATLMVSLGLITDAWARFAPVDETISTVLLLTLPLYTLLAIKRVFQLSWARALGKGVALFFIYVIMFAATLVSVFTYAFLQQH